MESFIAHERDRKNFVEYDDLKVMEKHLTEYMALQTESSGQSANSEVLKSFILKLKFNNNKHLGRAERK